MDINLGIAYFTYCSLFLNKYTACYENVFFFIPAKYMHLKFVHFCDSSDSHPLQ